MTARYRYQGGPRQRLMVDASGNVCPATVIGPIKPSPVVSMTEWPIGRQVALLLIERSAAALDCLAHMPGSMKKPSQEDFLWLRREGYAVRELGARYHRLTAYGGRKAHDLVTYRLDNWTSHHASCCCGFVAHAARFGNANPKATLQIAVSRHLDDPTQWIRQREATRTLMDSLFTGARDAG